MNIYLKVYLIGLTVIALLELFRTYVYTSAPARYRSEKEMDPITWLIGGLFMGAIWPLTIILHIIDYFLVLGKNGD